MPIVGSNTERLGKSQSGAVGCGLRPALNDGAERAHEDGEVERHGLAPFVLRLRTERAGLLVRKVRHIFGRGTILKEQRSFLKQGQFST